MGGGRVAETNLPGQKSWLSLAKTEMSVCILNQINVSEPEQGERNGSI